MGSVLVTDWLQLSQVFLLGGEFSNHVVWLFAIDVKGEEDIYVFHQ